MNKILIIFLFFSITNLSAKEKKKRDISREIRQRKYGKQLKFPFTCEESKDLLTKLQEKQNELKASDKGKTLGDLQKEHDKAMGEFVIYDGIDYYNKKMTTKLDELINKIKKDKNSSVDLTSSRALKNLLFVFMKEINEIKKNHTSFSKISFQCKNDPFKEENSFCKGLAQYKKEYQEPKNLEEILSNFGTAFSNSQEKFNDYKTLFEGNLKFENSLKTLKQSEIAPQKLWEKIVKEKKCSSLANEIGSSSYYDCLSSQAGNIDKLIIEKQIKLNEVSDKIEEVRKENKSYSHFQNLAKFLIRYMKLQCGEQSVSSLNCKISFSNDSKKIRFLTDSVGKILYRFHEEESVNLPVLSDTTGYDDLFQSCTELNIRDIAPKNSKLCEYFSIKKNEKINNTRRKVLSKEFYNNSTYDPKKKKRVKVDTSISMKPIFSHAVKETFSNWYKANSFNEAALNFQVQQGQQRMQYLSDMESWRTYIADQGYNHYGVLGGFDTYGLTPYFVPYYNPASFQGVYYNSTSFSNPVTNTGISGYSFGF